MPKSILEIAIKLTKEGQADKDVVNSLVGIKTGLMEMMGVAAAAAGVYYTMDKALEATVGKFVEYAGEVQNLKNITGDSAEDTSRMMKITEDYGLTVDNLTAAQKKLSAQGESLSTQTLARMSDEFIKLGKGAEQDKFLLDNFGKSGLGLATFMNLGSEAILRESAAVEKNLVLTDEQIARAQKLKLQQAELNDQWEAAKIGIGEKLVPALSSLMDYSSRYNEVITNQKASWMQYIPILGAGYSAYNQIAMLIRGTPNEASAAAAGINDLSVSLDRSEGSLMAARTAAFNFNQELAKNGPVKDTTKYVSDMAGEYSNLLSTLGQMDPRTQAVGMAFGQLNDQMITDMTNLHNFDAAMIAWGNKPITKDIVMRLYYQSFGVEAGGHDFGAGGMDQSSSPSVGDSGGAAKPYWIPDTSNPGHYKVNPGFAEGGSFVVPPNFPNDSYGMGVTSGEHVTVTPAGKSLSDNSDVVQRLDRLERTIITVLPKAIKDGFQTVIQ